MTKPFRQERGFSNCSLAFALFVTAVLSPFPGVLGQSETELVAPQQTASPEREDGSLPVFVYNNIDGYPHVRLSEGKVHLSFGLYGLSPLSEADAKSKVRVLRRELSDAEFLEHAYDITEFYQDDKSRAKVARVAYVPKQAESIFQRALGSLVNQRNGQTNLDLPARSHFTVEVIDTRVELGHVYFYWISLPTGDRLLGPIPVKVWDPDIVWTKARIDARVEALAVHYPEKVTLETFGLTAKHTPIRGAVIGNAENAVMLVGAIHPGESGPELIIPAAERALRDHAELLDRVGLIIIPSANPDIRERMARGCPFYLRRSPNGVDCNRNFPFMWGKVSNMYGVSTGDPNSPTYHGPSAGSEPETQAIVRAIERYQPRAVFSYHWMASITGHNFAVSHNTKQDADYVEQLRQWARIYTDGMYPDQTVELILGFDPIDSGLSGWCWSKNIAVLNLEGICLDPDEPRCKVWIAAGEFRTTVEMLKENQHRHYLGILATLKHAVRTH